jgi:predicted dienelactone hydrolase
MRTKRFLLGCVAAAGLVLAGPAIAVAEPAGFELPEPNGPYPVGTTELHLVDHDRADPWVAGATRELMVSVWYPAQPGEQPRAPYLLPGAAAAFDHQTSPSLGIAPGQIDFGVATHAGIGAAARPRAGGWPVVLYSPGATMPRSLGTALVEQLAAEGYVVVTIDHTHEAPAVDFPGGRVEPRQLPVSSPEVLKKMIATRVQDTTFVLDELETLAAGGNPDAEQRRLPAGLGRALDLSEIGMFGHSAGGFTTGETMVTDRRIDAGADLDGSLGYALSAGDFGTVAEQGLDRPFLLMSAGDHGSSSDPSWQAFLRNQRGWKLDLHVPAGEHFTFTDIQATLPQLAGKLDIAGERVAAAIGTVDPTRIVASERAYLTAFFDQHLRHRPQCLLNGPSPEHPDVEFVAG